MLRQLSFVLLVSGACKKDILASAVSAPRLFLSFGHWTGRKTIKKYCLFAGIHILFTAYYKPISRKSHVVVS